VLAIACPCVAALLLSACGARTARDGTPAAVPPEPPPAAARSDVPAGRVAYRLDEAGSAIRVLVFRDGPLARLGHNHVLRAGPPESQAWSGPGGALVGSSVRLRLAVAGFVVDDPADRALAGPEFATTVANSAREATMANLLRAEVLDATAHPSLQVQATLSALTGAAGVARVTVNVRGVEHEYEIPVTVEPEGEGTLALDGRLDLRHRDFGLQPFSIAGGAVAVADEFNVIFNLKFTPLHRTGCRSCGPGAGG
jgi:hypothetical protein